MPKKTVVFGGGGFIGSHVVQQLVLAGFQVTCVLRPGANTALFETLGVTTITVDFNADAQLQYALRGVSLVYNCIANTHAHVDISQREAVDVELTSRLFAAAQQSGASRFIQLSTVMSYGFSETMTVRDEQSKQTPVYAYAKVALAREQALIEQAQQHTGTQLIIMRPSNVIGARDHQCLGRLVAASRLGVFPVFGHTRWQFSCIDARDVGRAMAYAASLTLSHGCTCFVIKGYDTDWYALKNDLDKALQKTTRLMRLPKTAMLHLAQAIERMVPYGIPLPLTAFSVAVLSHHALYDDSAFRATGFTAHFNQMDSIQDYLASRLA